MKTFKKLLLIAGASIVLISCSNKDSGEGVQTTALTPQAQELNNFLGKEITEALTMEDLSKLEADIENYAQLDVDTDEKVEIAKRNIHDHINKWKAYLLTSNDKDMINKYNQLIMRGMEAKALSRPWLWLNESIPLLDHKEALHLIVGYEGMDVSIPQLFAKEAYKKTGFVPVEKTLEEGLKDFTNIYQARGHIVLMENEFCARKQHYGDKCNPAFKELYDLANTLQNEEQTQIFEELVESGETNIQIYQNRLAGKRSVTVDT